MREQTLHYELCTSVENSPQTNPLIARIDTKAGHGSGRPTQKIIDEASDAYSFFAMVTNSNWIG
jgi:prolyl oligopeptidase